VQATPEVETKEVPKAEQLSIFRELTNVVEEIYVYPDYNGKDWNEMESRYRARSRLGWIRDPSTRKCLL
jgi:hypothetical protein